MGPHATDDAFPFYGSVFPGTKEFVPGPTPSSTVTFKPHPTMMASQPVVDEEPEVSNLVRLMQFWNVNATEGDIDTDPVLTRFRKLAMVTSNKQFVFWFNGRMAARTAFRGFVHKLTPHLFCTSPLQGCRTYVDEFGKEGTGVFSTADEGFYLSLGPGRSISIPSRSDTTISTLEKYMDAHLSGKIATDNDVIDFIYEELGETVFPNLSTFPVKQRMRPNRPSKPSVAQANPAARPPITSPSAQQQASPASVAPSPVPAKPLQEKPTSTAQGSSQQTTASATPNDATITTPNNVASISSESANASAPPTEVKTSESANASAPPTEVNTSDVKTSDVETSDVKTSDVKTSDVKTSPVDASATPADVKTPPVDASATPAEVKTTSADANVADAAVKSSDDTVNSSSNADTAKTALDAKPSEGNVESITPVPPTTATSTTGVSNAVTMPQPLPQKVKELIDKNSKESFKKAMELLKTAHEDVVQRLSSLGFMKFDEAESIIKELKSNKREEYMKAIDAMLVFYDLKRGLPPPDVTAAERVIKNLDFNANWFGIAGTQKYSNTRTRGKKP